MTKTVGGSMTKTVGESRGHLDERTLSLIFHLYEICVVHTLQLIADYICFGDIIVHFPTASIFFHFVVLIGATPSQLYLGGTFSWKCC